MVSGMVANFSLVWGVAQLQLLKGDQITRSRSYVVVAATQYARERLLYSIVGIPIYKGKIM